MSNDLEITLDCVSNPMPSLPLLLIDAKGKQYTIQYAKNSGGKAGKGKNKTSTVQVIYLHFAVKQIRYTIGDYNSKREAVRKAITYVLGTKKAESFFSA